MSVMTDCKKDFEGSKKGELLLAGFLDVFIEELAFEMRLKRMGTFDEELLGEGHEGWREGRMHWQWEWGEVLKEE